MSYKLSASVPLKLLIGSVPGGAAGGITSKEINNIFINSKSFRCCHSEERKRRGILFGKDFSLPLEMTVWTDFECFFELLSAKISTRQHKPHLFLPSIFILFHKKGF